MAAEQPLVVIVGPTASGKTSLAIRLAEEYDGEIICADSRTIYRGMDIGTAKPTADEQARVPHWGLDLVYPGEYFSAAQFKQYAVQKIAEIRSRGRTPFLVGGSGLYVDAVLFDYQFGSRADDMLRKQLEQLTLEELHLYCESHNILLPENKHNKRYIIRAIEQKTINTKRRDTPIDNSIIVGITTEREKLRAQIVLRAEQMLTNGVVEEAILLGKKYGWDSEAMTGNIYPLIKLHQEGMLSRSEVEEKFATLDWRLAKRQLTWLRRNTSITWLPIGDARQYLVELLASSRVV